MSDCSLEKKNIYLTAFAGENEDQVRCTIEIDTIKQGTKFSDFLSDLFEIEAIVSVGSTFVKSELVYANKAYRELSEGVK